MLLYGTPRELVVRPDTIALITTGSKITGTNKNGGRRPMFRSQVVIYTVDAFFEKNRSKR
jgi:hypothetical protein